MFGTLFAHSHSLAPRRPSLVGWVAAKISEERRYRRTLNELRALSERELTDLGLSSADLVRIARDSAR